MRHAKDPLQQSSVSLAFGIFSSLKLTDCRSGALDWICKHCVNNIQGKDISAAGPPSIQLHYTDKAEHPSQSLPIGQSQAKAEMAASLTHHQKGPQDIDTRVAEQRVTFPEATNNGHPETSAGFDSRQPARVSISQNIPSSVEQLQNSDSSASQLNGRMADAKIVKEESMTGITSTSMLNGSSSPPRHAPTEQNGSIHNTNFPSHIRVGTDLAPLPNDTAAPRQPASVKTAATNGFGQDRRLTLGSSVSSETSTFGRNRAFRLDLDANHSEDDGTSTPPEKSQERPWNRSHLSTTTGELHQPQEPVLSKLEIQASKKALKRLTCYHWKQKGGCRYRDDECQYAHYDTGMDEGKNTTCFWWWKFGHCKKSERECLYAHRDTGLYAKPPPGYIPQKRKFFFWGNSLKLR